MEENDEKENDNTRSVLFAASPPKTFERNLEEERVILSLQSQITNIMKDLNEEKEKSRKCVKSLTDEFRQSQRDIAFLKAELDTVQKKVTQTQAEWEREKSKDHINKVSCCVVQ